MRFALPAAFALGAAIAFGAAWILRPAPQPTLDTAEVEAIVASYLREHPDSVVDAIRAYQARAEKTQIDEMRKAVRDRWDEIARNPDDPVLGNPEGDVTLVEFFDYRCGYCRRAHPDVLALKDMDPQLRIVMKEFPILGPESLVAAKASLAAHGQGKYADFHDALMQAPGQLDEALIMEMAELVGLDVERLRRDMESPEIEATLQRNFALAEELGLRGTPVFMTREEIAPGAVGHDALLSLIAAARKAAS